MSCHRFGPFTLHVSRRQLFVGDRETKLGGRALDLLVALVERAGEVVDTPSLMALVWPRQVVEDNTLRVHLAALRKVLSAADPGMRHIANIAGRGYSFVAPVQPVAPSDSALRAPRLDLDRQLPRLDVSLLGRDDTIAALDQQLDRERVVTLTGPGGIGKTSVAVTVARRIAARHAQGLWFVDLSLLPAGADAVDAALAVARLVGVAPAIDGLYLRLGERLAQGSHLLILDNCEHVVRAAAELVDALGRLAPALRVLSTSREPLCVTREQVHVLPSLALPEAGVCSLRDALASPAVALFVQRARAADHGFEPDDADAGWIAHICQGLDGVPLAIEHAAAMVRAFGLKSLAASLDDRFLLLCSSRRTAISRHQNLEAVLDWGYALLSEGEQRLLRWLSVFRGPVRLQEVLALARTDATEPPVTLATVHGLVLKSWLFPCTGKAEPSYRLHAVARSFAHQRLLTNGGPPPWLPRARTPSSTATAAPPPRAPARITRVARLNG